MLGFWFGQDVVTFHGTNKTPTFLKTLNFTSVHRTPLVQVIHFRIRTTHAPYNNLLRYISRPEPIFLSNKIYISSALGHVYLLLQNITSRKYIWTLTVFLISFCLFFLIFFLLFILIDLFTK